MKIRIGGELLVLMRQAEKRFDLSLGEQAERTIRWASKRDIDLDALIDPGAGNAAGTVISVKSDISGSNLRKLLFYRLPMELKKETIPEFKTTLKNGVDYLIC